MVRFYLRSVPNKKKWKLHFQVYIPFLLKCFTKLTETICISLFNHQKFVKICSVSCTPYYFRIYFLPHSDCGRL